MHGAGRVKRVLAGLRRGTIRAPGIESRPRAHHWEHREGSGSGSGSGPGSRTVGSIVSVPVSSSVYCVLPLHLRSTHFFEMRLRKYSLSNLSGCVVHAPSKPERTK